MASLMKEKYSKPISPNSVENEKHEELTFQMKRPCFPYQFWMQDLPWSTGAKVNPDWDETDVGITDLLNQAIISIAEKEAQFPINEEGLAIQRKMEKLLENVTEDLKTNHKSFKDSTLYYTGSMYEGLKIDAVDEFDFMIEMPVLSKVADISMKFTKQMLRFELKDLNPFDDLPIEKVKVDAANIQEYIKICEAWRRMDIPWR